MYLPQPHPFPDLPPPELCTVLVLPGVVTSAGGVRGLAGTAGPLLFQIAFRPLQVLFPHYTATQPSFARPDPIPTQAQPHIPLRTARPCSRAEHSHTCTDRPLHVIFPRNHSHTSPLHPSASTHPPTHGQTLIPRRNSHTCTDRPLHVIFSRITATHPPFARPDPFPAQT